MHKQRFAVVAAAVVAALATFTGCAGSSAAPSETPGTVRGISEDKVIKVGGFIAQSGPLGAIKSIKQAASLRFDKINEAGGVNGYTFDYVAVDDQADPSKTVAAVKQLWEDDEVFAIFLPYGTGANNAAKPYLLENDVPTLFPFSSAEVYFTMGEAPPPNVFGFLPPYVEFIDQLIVFASETKEVETFCAVHTNDDTGMSGPAALERLAPELGIEVIADIGFDNSETNFAPIGRRVAESGCDAVLLWALVGATEILDAAEESGFDGVWFGQDAFRGGIFLDALKENPQLDGRFFISTYMTPAEGGDPEVGEYYDAFTEAFPNDDLLFAQPGWVTADFLVQMVKRATDGDEALTWDSLKETMESVNDESLSGAHGVTWSPDFRYGITKAAVRSFNGSEFETVTDFETLPGFR